MAIHFYPTIGGRVDFDTPEEASKFFELTGGGTIETHKTEVKTHQAMVQDSMSPATSSTKVRAKRRTSGLKQRLEDSIQISMGGREMTAPEVYEKLKEKDWLPDSKDPLNYIRYILSSNKSIFKSESRGRYHLDSSNPYAVGNVEAPIEGYVNPKSTKTKKNAIPTKTAVVEESGIEDQAGESPEPEVVAEDPITQAPISATQQVAVENPEPEDSEDLITQLSQESPVVETHMVVAPPTPVRLTIVESPKVESSEDPVLDILNEFAQVMT